MLRLVKETRRSHFGSMKRAILRTTSTSQVNVVKPSQQETCVNQFVSARVSCDLLAMSKVLNSTQFKHESKANKSIIKEQLLPTMKLWLGEKHPKTVPTVQWLKGFVCCDVDISKSDELSEILSTLIEDFNRSPPECPDEFNDYLYLFAKLRVHWNDLPSQSRKTAFQQINTFWKDFTHGNICQTLKLISDIGLKWSYLPSRIQYKFIFTVEKYQKHFSHPEESGLLLSLGWMELPLETVPPRQSDVVFELGVNVFKHHQEVGNLEMNTAKEVIALLTALADMRPVFENLPLELRFQLCSAIFTCQLLIADKEYEDMAAVLQCMDVNLDNLLKSPVQYTKEKENTPLMSLRTMNSHLSQCIEEGAVWSDLPNSFRKMLFLSVETHIKEGKLFTQNIGTVASIIHSIGASQTEWNELPQSFTNKLILGVCTDDILGSTTMSKLVSSFAKMNFKYSDLHTQLQAKIKHDLSVNPVNMFDKTSPTVFSECIHGLGALQSPTDILQLDKLEHSLNHYQNEFALHDVANIVQGVAELGLTFKLMSLSIMMGIEREVGRNLDGHSKLDRKSLVRIIRALPPLTGEDNYELMHIINSAIRNDHNSHNSSNNSKISAHNGRDCSGSDDGEGCDSEQDSVQEGFLLESDKFATPAAKRAKQANINKRKRITLLNNSSSTLETGTGSVAVIAGTHNTTDTMEAAAAHTTIPPTAPKVPLASLYNVTTSDQLLNEVNLLTEEEQYLVDHMRVMWNIHRMLITEYHKNMFITDDNDELLQLSEEDKNKQTNIDNYLAFLEALPGGFSFLNDVYERMAYADETPEQRAERLSRQSAEIREVIVDNVAISGTAAVSDSAASITTTAEVQRNAVGSVDNSETSSEQQPEQQTITPASSRIQPQPRFSSSKPSAYQLKVMREIDKQLFFLDRNYSIQHVFAAPTGVDTAFCPVFHCKSLVAFVLISDDDARRTIKGMVQDAQTNIRELNEAFPGVTILQLDTSGKPVTAIARDYSDLIKFNHVVL